MLWELQKELPNDFRSTMKELQNKFLKELHEKFFKGNTDEIPKQFLEASDKGIAEDDL